MQRTEAQESVVSLLFAWFVYKIAQQFAAMKPRHGTEQIARAVARSGNPPGA